MSSKPNSLSRTVSKPARMLVCTQNTDAPAPVTQLGGQPWWPQGIERPHCGQGHAMALIMQVRLSDVPGLEQDTALLSFHYCQQCTQEGNMSFGWTQPEQRDGYDVRVFEIEGVEPDGLGILYDSPVGPYRCQFVDYAETVTVTEDMDYPEYALEWNGWIASGLKRGLLAEVDSDAEEPFPDFSHLEEAPELKAGYNSQTFEPRSGSRTKLGGWPLWMQDPEWPTQATGESMIFVGHIDWRLGRCASWGGGGYAYLFVDGPEVSPRLGEFALSTT